MKKEEMLALLKKDVVPALGCTEPVCIALCAAHAGSVLTEKILELEVTVSAGIGKNAMSAGIPHCDQVGMDWAAAIGALLKQPEGGLELLAGLTPEILAEANALVPHVSVEVDDTAGGIFVKCTARTGSETAVAVIRGSHTNLIHLSRNGRILAEGAVAAASGQDPEVEKLTALTLGEIWELVCSASGEELDFLMDGVDMNDRLAAYSETNAAGVGLAESLRGPLAEKLMQDTLASRIALKVTSAAESRLDGCPLPTMSSSGAGTKGLVVTLPVSETARYLGASRLQTLRALALAHLVNRYINAHVGKLSPMCSCVVCSSTAAACGITVLLGGGSGEIGWAVRNMTGTVTGMLCDGGKVGCAMKVATGSFAALMSAVHAVNGAALRPSDGICAESAEDCIRNMASVGNRGMTGTNEEILRIMTGK